MSSRLLVAVAGAFALSHLVAFSQSVGFVQFEAPGKANEGAGSNVLGSARFIENSYGLDWAVLESNRLELQHRLDFVVVTLDFGVFKPDPGAAAKEIANTLRGLTTNRVFLLAGPCLQAPEVRIRYGRFVAEMKKEMPLPLHTVLDLTGSSQHVGDFTVIGLDTAALGLDGSREKEISRVEGSLRSAQIALVFGSIESMPATGRVEVRSLAKSREWERVATNQKISGIFLSVLGKTAQIGPRFPSLNDKPGDLGARTLFLAPRIDAAIPASARGLLFARAARDGHIATDPIWMRSAFEGEAPDLRNAVIEAALKEQNGEYKEAYKLYNDALKSKDAHVRTLAEAGLRRTDQALHGWRETWKAGSIAVAWLTAHWRDLLIGSFFVGLIALWAWSRYLKPNALVIEIPEKLSTDAPAELFLLEFLDAAKMIRDTWAEVPLGLDANKGANVTFYTVLGKDIASQIESLKLAGMDLKTLAKWVLFLWRYFSWKLELSVYGSTGQMVVHARRRWAWRTLDVWMEPSSVTGPMNLNAAAWALAYDVIGAGVVQS